MRNWRKLAFGLFLMTAAGCNDTCHDSPTEGSGAKGESGSTGEETTTEEVTTKITVRIAKGAGFFFTATATSDKEGSLDSGAWTVEDVTNQPVAQETGVQMSLSLDRHPNRCEFFSVAFSPTMNEGFNALDPRIQRLEWPDEPECQPKKHVCDFSCNDIGNFEISCLNRTTGEAPFTCGFSFGDPNGSSTEECGFNGLTHRYDSAGSFNVTLKSRDRFDDECAITKAVRVD